MSDYAPNSTVAAPDSVANSLVRDVVGNKSDVASVVAGQASLVALLRAALASLGTVDGLHDVPAQDAVTNLLLRDVVGNKLDGASEAAGTASLVALIRAVLLNLGVIDGFHDVPAPDAVTNILIGEVIGNKADAASAAVGTASIVALARQVLAYHAVPAQDSVANALARDVLGQKTDTHSGNSAMARLHTWDEHAHSPSKVLPDLAGAVTVTAAVGAWTYGAEAVLGTPAGDYDVHWISVIANANDEYQIALVRGAAVIGEASFRRVNAAAVDFDKPIQTPVGSGQLTAKLASAAGSSTATIKVLYHDY